MSSLSKEIEDFLAEGYAEVEADMEAAGEAAVAYNREYGDYNNVTGNLRRSNYYEIESEGGIPQRLVIGNSADYAAEVESRRMVITDGVLLAEKMLQG